MKKKRKLKKRLIIALSFLLTLTVAVVLFCSITGFNIYTFIFGTKASGEVANEETDLVTTTAEAPTDGSTAADHTALENFSYFAYILEHSNFEAETNGAANAKYNGMNVKQSVYDYRKVAGDYALTDTRSVSTFVKIYHEQFYTNSKVLYRQGETSDYSSMSVAARSNKQEFELYGYGPDHITGYIVCADTIINSPVVTLNDDGTYTSVYELSPTVAPTYYQKKVKTNASISSYPRFSEITLTYTYTADWKIVKASYHEIYSIYKMKSWIETTNDIEEVFTYLDDTASISQYDFYKDYFNLEVPADDEENPDSNSDEMTALDYLGTMANLINGKYINVDANIKLNDTLYNALVYVEMGNYNTEIIIGDTTIIYKDNKLYIKGDNKSYYDIEELSPLLEALGLSDIKSSSSIDTDALISSIMADINNGSVEKIDNSVKVSITFNLLGYQIPVVFNFNTPDENTVEFVNLESSFDLYNNSISLDAKVNNNDVVFEDVTDGYTKLDFAFDGEVSTSITYKDQTYSLTGNIYLNLINQKANINLKLNAFDNTYDISLYLLDNALYLNINDILKTKITIDDIKNIINDKETNTASLDTSNINVEEIINYIKKIFISFDDGLSLSLKEELTFGDVTINSINLKLSDSTYKTFDLDDKESYISFDNFKEVINSLISYDFNNFALDINLDLVYEDYTLNITGHYYNNDKSLYLDIKYNDEIINIIYKDNVVYLSLLDNYYKLNIDEFKDLFNTNTSIDISSLLSILDDVKITYEDKLVLSIKDYKFYLNKTDKGYSINSNIEYNGLKINNLNVELYESNNTTNITHEYKEIGLYNEGSLDLSILYKEEEINLNAIYYINLKDKEITVDASVTLYDSSYNVKLIYKNNTIYLSFKDYNFKYTLPELTNISFDNLDIESILNKLKEIDLSSLDSLNISLNSFEFDITKVEYKEINVDESIYTNNLNDLIDEIKNIVDNDNFDGFVDYIKNIIDLTSNKTLGITINNIKVSDFKLNGNVNIYFVNSIEVNAALTINYKDYSMDVNLILKDKYIYITFSNQTIKVGLEDISTFIDKVITKLNETFDLNINLDTNINISYSDILNVIKGITLDTNKISIDLSSVLDKEYTLDINYDNNNLIINDSNNNLFDLTFKSVDYEDLTVPTKSISEDDILDIIDYVSIFYNMIDDKDFAFNINTTLSKNGSVVATIVGDIYLQVLEDNKYNAKVNLIIEEFDNGTKTMWHQLNITLYNDMIYATYGNNESNKDKVIKAYMSYDGLLNLIESIKQLTNIKIIDDLLNSTTSLDIDLNKIINDISLLDNSLVVNLEQSAIHKAMENSYLLNLVINKNESSITSIEASNIYASFTNKNTYFRLDNLEVSLLNSEVEYTVPSDTSGYIDLSNLSEVITPLYNNAMQREYEISGTITLKALSMFSVDVPVTIKIKTDDDGIPMIHGHIDMTNISKLYTSLASRKTIDIYYKDSYVYINRQDNDGNNYKCKIHYETFLDDITYYLLDYSMGLSSTIMDLVNNSSSTGDGFVDAADCLNSAEIGTDYFKLSLDLGEIVDNPDLGDLSLQINSSSVLVDNEYKKLFTTITNFKFDMVSVIDLKCSKLELSNIKANDNGDLVINEVDMSSTLEYIADFNNNYKTDTYYKNGNVVSTLTHSVIFDLGDVNNITKSYSEGDLIIFPEYANDIIEVTQDDITKYYKIKGWYYDSSYLNKIDDIKSIYMKNNKVIYYAKVEDITVNLTISSDYYDDLVITTYKGADISSTIDSYFAMINNKTEMIVFSGLYSGDTLFDYKNISKSGEFSLTAKFDNVNYDFVVKYGNTVNTSSIIDINSDEAFISISKYVFLLNNNVLYEYSGSVLTPKYLADNFFSFFVRDDEKKTFTLTLYLASDSIFNDYYKITYNVNSNFNNKDYVSFYILKNQSTDIRSLLPSGTYSTYEINAWNDGSKYYSLYDLSNVSTSLTLEALITTSTSDYTFEIDGDGAKITKYNGSSEFVIIPRYAVIDGVYLVVNTIGSEAFMGNTSIKTVVLNDGLVTIGSNAFKNCPSLVSVYFSDSVTTVNSDAFFEDTSSTYETNRDIAVARRFYFTSNSTFKESDLTSWLACRWNSTDRYYECGKYTVFFVNHGDFRNAYQTYSSTIIDLINSLI